MQVAKWGNSLAIRLPAAVVEALKLKEGDEIEIHVADVRQFGVARKPGRDELLSRLRAFRGGFRLWEESKRSKGHRVRRASRQEPGKKMAKPE